MKKYDFKSMGGIWKDTAQKITKNGVFVAHDGSWDLWEYAGTVYAIPVAGTGCAASVWCAVSNLRRHLCRLRKICKYSALIPAYWENVNADFLKNNNLF